MPIAKRNSVSSPQRTEWPTYSSLCVDLNSSEARRRRHAAQNLANVSEAAADLRDARSVETDESVRETIFTALIRIRSPAAAAALLPCLHGEDVSLRNGATEALKMMPHAAEFSVRMVLACLAATSS